MNEQEKTVIELYINNQGKLTEDQKIIWDNLLNKLKNPDVLNDALDSLDAENKELTSKFTSLLQETNGIISLIDDELTAMQITDILKFRKSVQRYDEAMQQSVQKVKQGIENYQKEREESVQREINSDAGALTNNLQYQKARVSVRAQLQLLLDKYKGLMDKYPDNNTMKQFRKSVEDYIKLGERWGDNIKDQYGNRITEILEFRERYRDEIIKKTGEEQILLRDMMEYSQQFLKERTNAQFDTDDDNLDDVSAWAAAEEFNQIIAPLNNGYLDLNNPYPYTLKDENGNELFSELEPIRVQYIGKDAVNCTRNLDGRKIKINLRQADSRMLFTHEPSPVDVVQKSLGNCYMLAGLASVAEKYPDKIKESMIEHTIMVQDQFGRKHPKDVVTVRFFKKEVDQKNGKLLGYTPVLVTVDKVVPDNYGNTAALWVQMIERAYAASGLHLDPSQTGAPLQGKVNLEKVKAEYEKPGLTKYDRLIVVAENPQAFRVGENNAYALRDSETPDLLEIEAGAGDQFLEQFLGPEGERVHSDFKDYQGQESAQKVAEFIRANKNNVITAGTNNLVYNEYGHDPKGLGWNQSGLLASHDYSILGIEERTFYVNNDPAQPVKKEVVVLRNPMGVGGRTNSYDNTFDVLNANEQSNTEGVFEISLQDFCRNFASLRANKISEFIKVGHPSKDNDPVQRFGHDYFTKQTQLSYMKQLRYFANSLYKTNQQLKDRFKPLLDTVDDVMKRLVRDNKCSTHMFLKEEKDDFDTITRNCENFLKMNDPDINRFADTFKGLQGLCLALQLGYTDPTEYLQSKGMDYDKTVKVDVMPQDVIQEKIPKQHVNVYVPNEIENVHDTGIVQDVAFTKADYVKALKDVYAGLRETDDNYSDLKNSSEYKKMRKDLDTFIKDLEKAGDETSIAELFNNNKGSDLRNRCKNYVKHCFNKVRNNDRRNKRLDEATTAMKLLTAMSKNVTSLGGIKDCMRLAYAEKAIREKMYSLSASEDKIAVAQSENIRKLMAERRPGDFANLLSEFYNSPEIKNALDEKSFDQIHNELKTDTSGLFKNVAEVNIRGEMKKDQAAKLIKM